MSFFEGSRSYRTRLEFSAPSGPTPEQRRRRLNDAIQAITKDDVRTVVSCIPGHIDVSAVYDLILGAFEVQEDVEGAGSRGRRVTASLLHLALHHKAPHCAKLLLHLGAPTEATESLLGDRALHSAIRVGTYHLVSMLLDYGASPISLNRSLDTPLHLAAERGKVHVVRSLLEVGADPIARNIYQETPWDLAITSGSPSAVVCGDLILTHHLQQKSHD